MVRLVALAAVLVAGACFAQVPAMDPCTSKCGDKLTNATKRCGNDTRCLQRGVQQMDTCNMQCAMRAKPQAMPKKCPGQNGKMVNCSDMMAPPPPPKQVEHEEGPKQP